MAFGVWQTRVIAERNITLDLVEEGCFRLLTLIWRSTTYINNFNILQIPWLYVLLGSSIYVMKLA